MAGMASKIHCLEDENRMSEPVHVYFLKSKHLKSPVDRPGSELAPKHFQVFKASYTEELNEFQELQRGILMDSLDIVGNQMIQNLDNLRTQD